ncbi:MAG: hypothetical protein M3459_04285, partial [Actinomycetota bacterium]|nr:hypothetical protein [Actinomycetota bacterium]
LAAAQPECAVDPLPELGQAQAGDLGAGGRPAMALYREGPMDLEVLHELAGAAHERDPGDYDEIDELFRGGR